MSLRSIIAAVCGLSLTACATTGPEADRGGVHPQAAALADLLIETGRNDPERIESAGLEMAALRAALRPPAPQSAPIQAPSMEMAEAVSGPAPAPDLSGARSVMSAVHLASYRQLEHAAAGWLELRAQHGSVLANLEPRLAEADLGERGVFLRLKAGPLDSPEAARALCAEVEAAGQWCAPSDFNGRALP
jgi:hypothetical protein